MYHYSFVPPIPHPKITQILDEQLTLACCLPSLILNLPISSGFWKALKEQYMSSDVFHLEPVFSQKSSEILLTRYSKVELFLSLTMIYMPTLSTPCIDISQACIVVSIHPKSFFYLLYLSRWQISIHADLFYNRIHCVLLFSVLFFMQFLLVLFTPLDSL